MTMAARSMDATGQTRLRGFRWPSPPSGPLTGTPWIVSLLGTGRTGCIPFEAAPGGDRSLWQEGGRDCRGHDRCRQRARLLLREPVRSGLCICTHVGGWLQRRCRLAGGQSPRDSTRRLTMQGPRAKRRARSLVFRVRVIPCPCCTGRNPFSWLTRARSSVVSCGTPAPAKLGRAWRSIVMAPQRQPTRRRAVTRFAGSERTSPYSALGLRRPLRRPARPRGQGPRHRGLCSRYGRHRRDSLTTDRPVITGRLIDAATGKGIRGDIRLSALADNAFARMLPLSRL